MEELHGAQNCEKSLIESGGGVGALGSAALSTVSLALLGSPQFLVTQPHRLGLHT